MSLSVVKDPRLEFDIPQIIVLNEGIANVNPQTINANSFSNSNISFENVSPQNGRLSVIDRKIYIVYPVTLTFTGTSVGPTLLQIGTNDALRSFPFSQLMNSVTFSINNTNITETPIDYIEPLLRYGTKFNGLEGIDWSMSPSMPDQYQDYADWLTFGSSKNALGGYGVSYMQQGRGGFSDLTIISDDGTTAVVEAVVTEPLFLSPLLWGHKQSKGLFNINTMSLTIQFDRLNRIWSHSSAGETINNIDVNFGTSTMAKPLMLLTYLSPKLSLNTNSINRYNYNDVQSLITAGNTLNSGDSTTITTNSVNLGSVPMRMYFFVRRTKNSRTFNDTDTYFAIDRFSLFFGDTQNALANADKRQLYKISAENGFNASYDAANNYVGHVLCVDFAKDISLSDGVLPGMSGSFTTYAQLTVRNLNANPVPYETTTITVSEGVITISGDTVEVSRVSLSQAQADGIEKKQIMNYYDVRDPDGGTFLNSAKNFGRAAAPYAKKALKGMKTALPYVEKAAASIIPMLMAAGLTEKQALKEYKCGGGRIMGGYVNGGACSSKAQRKRKLNDLLY